MSATIWKFPLAIVDEQVILMPADSHILAVQTQGEVPCLWAFIENPQAPTQERTIVVMGTGNPFPAEDGAHFMYLGTCQTYGGALIWHVFEKMRKPQLFKEGSGGL